MSHGAIVQDPHSTAQWIDWGISLVEEGKHPEDAGSVADQFMVPGYAMLEMAYLLAQARGIHTIDEAYLAGARIASTDEEVGIATGRV